MADVTNMTTERLAALRARATDALELAVAASAPLAVMEKLAAAAGMLHALGEVPNHGLVPEVVARAERALRAWTKWKEESARTALA